MNVASIIPLADGYGMHGDFGGWWMLLMMPLMLLFWVAVIWGIVWLARGGVQGGSPPAESHVSRASPLEVLDRRFAEGAMTEDDYRARREVLVGGKR